MSGWNGEALKLQMHACLAAPCVFMIKWKAPDADDTCCWGAEGGFMLNRRAPDAVDACQVRCSGWSHADAASACQPKIVKSA